MMGFWLHSVPASILHRYCSSVRIQDERVRFIHNYQLRCIDQKILDPKNVFLASKVISKPFWVGGIRWLDNPLIKSQKWFTMPMKPRTHLTDVDSGKSLIPWILESLCKTPISSKICHKHSMDCITKEYFDGFSPTLKAAIRDRIWSRTVRKSSTVLP